MLKWGLLGTSFISRTFAEAILGSPKSRIEAVFGRDNGRRAEFAAKYGIGKQYDSMHALISDPEVDVIYVGLPNHLHAEAVTASACNGKAVLSEKSLATTEGDAVAMIAAVKAADTFFLEGLMYLCHPFAQKAGEIISAGRLGIVRAVTGHYAADIWKFANPLGMGTIYNLGCYPVSLLHFVVETAFGAEVFSNRTMFATGNISEHDGTVCDASLNVRFDNGMLATLQSSDTFGMDFGFAVQGENAVMRFKTNPWLPIPRDNVIEIIEYDGNVEAVVVSTGMDAFAHQVRRVEDCLADGLKQAPRPSPSPENSLDILRMLCEWEAKVRQAAKGKS